MSTLAEVSTRRQGVSAESVQVTSSYAEVARDLLATISSLVASSSSGCLPFGVTRPSMLLDLIYAGQQRVCLPLSAFVRRREADKAQSSGCAPPWPKGLGALDVG